MDGRADELPPILFYPAEQAGDESALEHLLASIIARVAGGHGQTDAVQLEHRSNKSAA